MTKQKTGPRGPGASPKTRNALTQDATTDSGELPNASGANPSGVIDGVAGAGGSSGTGSAKVKTTALGDTSGIDHPDTEEVFAEDEIPDVEGKLNKRNREAATDNDATRR